MLKIYEIFRGIFIATVSLILAGCAEQLVEFDKGLGQLAEQHTSVDIVTGERSVNLYDRDKQIKIGDQAAVSMIIAMAGAKIPLNRDANAKQYARLKRVFSKVHSVSHFRGEQWNPTLVGSYEWNAFVTGGKYLFVNLGLMRSLKSDDELAAVIGHEIAHIAANHKFEKDSHVQVASLLGSKSAKRKHFHVAFTHEQEEEADKIGILYMALAGYNPQAAVKVWQKQFSQSGDGNILMRSHPANSARLQNARVIAGKVHQYYSPGVKNRNYFAILRNNALWKSKKSNIAKGKGGGLLSLMEGIAGGLSEHAQAKAEEKRQRQEHYERNRPRITWAMRDSCNDGRDIEYRFFAVNNNQITGAWPGNNRVYVAKEKGRSDSHTLPCSAGYNKICYGGQSAGGRWWGIGLNGQERCTDCCWSCPASGESKNTVNMGC